MAKVTMTLKEIMAIPEEELRAEEESIKRTPCDYDPDCPPRTMEQLKAMGWRRANRANKEA